MLSVRDIARAFAVCLGLTSLGQASAHTLRNADWQVEIDPRTLAIYVQPPGHAAVQVSTGVGPHRVSGVRHADDTLRWLWGKGEYTLQAVLEGRQLTLTIQARQPGELRFLQQPASAMGKALIWPLAEGRYVPRGQPHWQRFLVDHGTFDTTQDLSLPLWGMDHGTFGLTWLMLNPFDNQLAVKPEGDGVGIVASHGFSALDPAAPLTLRLHLDTADPLAGARHYRQWLIDNGRFETLAKKLERTPQAQRLLGAAHVYVWGNSLLAAGDVRDWSAFMTTLRADTPLVARLRGVFDRDALKLLDASPPIPERWQRRALLREFNNAVDTLTRRAWMHTEVPDVQALTGSYADMREQILALFGSTLTQNPGNWGDGLTERMVRRLREAGLERLWLGLGEGWEGGLWHPEAVRQGVAAGYLVAPYDSYETALAGAENPTWTTAHLGAAAHRDCAVMLRDGGLRKGFQQSGHYTDPRCVRPLREARVQALQAAAGFNSWFLDAYAAGMLFESYRPGATMTQVQNAQGNIDASTWITHTLGLPTGSEDGNAVTAGGILFAHGMQTPVIGWGDEAMQRDRQSPWYVGQWYPPDQPQVFFRQVPLKDQYVALHFAPQARLPLYQAVFHGSVITTHHWLFDSLKLSNVRVANELTQLLYNVPPLYHLNADTLAERLPLMRKQDAFFRPLHQRLATQALTGFQWLAADRQVQQTTFADGTRLQANFSDEPREVAGRSLPAHSITALLPDGQVQVYRSGGV